MAIPPDFDHLVQGLQKTDPRLYDIIQRLIDQVTDIQKDLVPLVRQSKIQEAGEAEIEPPVDISVTFTETTIRLQWAPGDDQSRFYEIRRGSDWNTATYIVTTAATDIHITPIAGTPQIFLIKAIDINNNRSIKTAVAEAIPELPGVPAVSVEVIDNNVLLRWQVPPSTFQIRHYEIYKGATLVGYREGTFTTYFEQVAGNYTYGILAVDIAGNRGTMARVSAYVNQPPDYLLTDKKNSDFGGKKIRVKVVTDPSIQPAA